MAEHWVEALLDFLDPVEMTVRAQSLPADDQGRLNWEAFFTRSPKDSMKLREMTTVDFRPVADRREWDARGRLYAPKTPSLREAEFIPIEMYYKIGEKEQNDLAARFLGSVDLALQQMRASIPQRNDDIVMADYRRVELDAFRAWALGEMVVMNPTDGTTYTVDFGFDAARYLTAGTAWNNVAVNAYDEFLAFLTDAENLISGTPIGAVMRRATLAAIKADAPTETGIELTIAQLEAQLAADLGGPFRIVIMENTVETFNDGGHATTSVKVWPAEIVAAIPPGGVVGEVGFAPVHRAFELAATEPGAEIDVRGVTVVREIDGGGRGLTVEAQLNAFPLPNEQRLYVIDAGV
jgi:hypothetical protein